ncbi:SMP-30/gluconolactonase/LRE family protein [Rugosimonospora africana]|uniref:Gluconolactonase n=1 Tax=Rugosimonospora africana TaxID=556532 RepID=A0A8J3VVH9_9ACTN|nr:SMP-30/gluconolactonase/LRE family protein [Rugosimonospora africana]GIH20290.1 gluconolactonase [Rugosimonospora africana]
MSEEVQQFTEPLAHHGEGPVWADSWDGLRFVDMLAGDIVSLDATGEQADRLHLDAVAAAFRPRTGGGMVVAVERGFVLVDGDGTVRALDPLWSDPTVRMNEGGCDPDGRFYCGSMEYHAAPGAGSMYRLDPDGSVTPMWSEVSCSNGLAWTADGSRAYYTDSKTHRIDVFDYDSGSGLTGRRPFVRIPEALGLPDGLTVDSDGYVWVALYGGSAVHRYRPDGMLDGALELPVSQVTACTFGGPGLAELYITTSREDVEPGSQPEAGAVFRARPGVAGLPTRPFAG